MMPWKDRFESLKNSGLPGEPADRSCDYALPPRLFINCSFLLYGAISLCTGLIWLFIIACLTTKAMLASGQMIFELSLAKAGCGKYTNWPRENPDFKGSPLAIRLEQLEERTPYYASYRKPRTARSAGCKEIFTGVPVFFASGFMWFFGAVAAIFNR